MSIAINESEKAVSFYDFMSSMHEKFSCAAGWTLSYNDKDSLITDTLIIPVTNYKLLVVDNENKPDTSVDVFWEATDPSHSYYTFEQYFQKLLSSGIWNLRIFKTRAPTKFCFNERTTCYPTVCGCLESWSGTYINTPSTILDTIVISHTSTISPVRTSIHNDIHFSALSNHSRTINFAVSSPQDYGRGSISILTVSGKIIGRVDLRIDGPGTHVIEWKSGENGQGALASGKYLCKLTIDGSLVASSQVMVR